MSDWPSPLKVHLGCGRIYLNGYVNVDMDGPGVVLAGHSEGQQLLPHFATDDGDDYYKHQPVTPANIDSPPLKCPDNKLVDVTADVLAGLPFPCNSVDELLCRQMFEHLSPTEAKRFLANVDYTIAPGGTLRIDVPDHEETMRLYAKDPDNPIWKRHIWGKQDGPYNYHLMGYTREGLRALVERFGFVFSHEAPPLKNRLYPAFELVFRKPTLAMLDPLPWQRLIHDPIPDEWRCLEIGPGSRTFWPRANAVLDVVLRGEADLPPGVPCTEGDICQRTPWADDEFDFVLATHVLEHVTDPIAACAEISRIGQRGLIECPTAFKDFLFGFEEEDHRWWVWPSRETDELIFQRPDPSLVEPWRAMARDSGWGAAMHRIMRMGPQLGADGKMLRDAYVAGQRGEVLNVVHRWNGTLKARVL